MSLTLYGLKNCDTCKKAMKALTAEGVAFDFVDIRADADLPQRVPEWLAAIGAEKLVNRRSTTWRGLSEAARGGDPAALLVDNPTLVKRPVIVRGDEIFVGWTATEQAALLS